VLRTTKAAIEVSIAAKSAASTAVAIMKATAGVATVFRPTARDESARGAGGGAAAGDGARTERCGTVRVCSW
jgi:hypothetical protein